MELVPADDADLRSRGGVHIGHRLGSDTDESNSKWAFLSEKDKGVRKSSPESKSQLLSSYYFFMIHQDSFILNKDNREQIGLKSLGLSSDKRLLKPFYLRPLTAETPVRNRLGLPAILGGYYQPPFY